MKLYVLDNLSEYTEQDLQRDLQLLPAWRRERALAYKHLPGRRDCTLSYLLLCRALKEVFGITSQPTFLIGEHGKPSLREFPHLHFNLSHCSQAIACAVSEHPIGIDVESIERKITPSLINHTMNPEEREIIAEDPVQFFRFWTQKEAVVKLLGTGLQDNLHEILSPKNIPNIILHTQEHREKGYVISIATKE